MIESGVFRIIEPIAIKKFEFNVHGEHLEDKGKLKLALNFKPEARRKKAKEYEITLETVIEAIVVNNEEDKEMDYFSVHSTIVMKIEFSEENKENEKLLNNAVAIMYSYLRPIVAQMTVMAKLSPLDLQPLNFEQIQINLQDDLKSS